MSQWEKHANREYRAQKLQQNINIIIPYKEITLHTFNNMSALLRRNEIPCTLAML